MSTNTTTPRPDSVKAMLEDAQHGSFWSRRRNVLLLVLLAGAVLFAWLLLRPAANDEVNYRSEVTRVGTLTTRISATGNLQPLNQVDIGVELSGTIEAVLVDNNDEVVQGQQLARLSTTLLDDTVSRSRAALVSAKAKVQQAAASSKEARLKVQRLRQLHHSSGGRLPAQAELESAQAALDTASASESVAKAGVDSALAELRSAETSLAKASITSPINGVVLNRAVEPGQTVAASLSTPTLFTLAEDLSQMQLEVSVDEADVGQVEAGQHASFSVDAWPGRQYAAHISRVSLGSTITNNVVSYLTTLTVENADLSLRPGMTATAIIITQERKQALLVAAAALSFDPNQTDSASPAKAQSNSSVISKLLPRPPTQAKEKHSNSGDTNSAGAHTVWLLRDGTPAAIEIITGLSDGRFSEVLSGDLQPGMAVLTGIEDAAP